MVRVITTGDTARVVLDRGRSLPRDVGEVVASVRQCADAGVAELVIAVPELEQMEQGFLEILEEALVDTPDPLRIWVAVGDPDRYQYARSAG